MTTSYWFPWIARVSPQTFRADVIAAVTGASLAIPQGVAFATIAGLPPEYGFYCAIVAPIIAILIGSSWHMVCGPTTAISALLFGALHHDFSAGSEAYIQAVITLTFLAGVIQTALGLSRFGIITHFVSHAVMSGFITGAALLIIFSQIDHALQIELPRAESLIDYFYTFPDRLSHASLYAALISIFTITVAVICKLFSPALPHYLIALISGSVLGYIFGQNGAEILTIGPLPGMVPPLSMPTLHPELIEQIMPSAIAIALVGLLEAASIAKAISLKTDQKIDVNREFIGQGMSNFIGSFFSSYMSSGSFTRSGINVETGAKTPLAVVLMSLFLLILLPLMAPLFAHLPIAAIASVIILVGWKLIAFEEIRRYLHSSRKEIVILIATLLGTLLVSMEFGLYVGVGLSICLFLKRTMEPVVKTIAPLQSSQGTFFHNAHRFDLNTCPQIHFISIDGPLFFGSVEHIDQKLTAIMAREGTKPFWIFNGNGISDLDIHGAHYLKDIISRHLHSGGHIAFVMRSQWKLKQCREYHLMETVGEENLYPAKQMAIQQIVPQLNQSICQQCKHKIFFECPGKEPGSTISQSISVGNGHEESVLP
ncbi:SulP family inorganic anion transporter [Vibrio mangrovi]|uniref:Putative sulfate transporter/MT1781 n=1 Tax=Vibrio mangrovi TaxID=474394 RepID=A0A1Y6ISJ8_9VIBR|nr:SulP family inorganic anion transporter [Vibrio mangrovi]MDW6001353.1 SulP family inorganic anion transporter [Vibrio mangrovi]SMS00625.1 putative sulfate transporter/MT1781 [Vibrio mangrovi]